MEGCTYVCRDNLDPDLAPWTPSARGKSLVALDFLDLVHQIDTQWPEYRRNFVAIVVIQSGVSAGGLTPPLGHGSLAG
jgi:hypothetical protein